MQLLCALLISVPPALGLEAEHLELRRMEARGLRIGAILIETYDVFDLNDPAENKLLYRLANRLHVQTRPQVIERQLLFRSGELLSVRLIEETERLLRGNRYLYDVSIEPGAEVDGVVDLIVRVRDTWSTQPSISFGRGGGRNSTSFSLNEYNLAGTGVRLGLSHRKDPQRSSDEFSLTREPSGGGQLHSRLLLADNSDGHHRELVVELPFIAADSRRSWAVRALHDEKRIEKFDRESLLSAYHQQEESLDAGAGWSDGLIDGWVRRISLGMQLQARRDDPIPGETAPAGLLAPRRIATPWLRLALFEERVAERSNHDTIARPEYFRLGVRGDVELRYPVASDGPVSETLAWRFNLAYTTTPSERSTLAYSLRADGGRGDDPTDVPNWGLSTRAYHRHAGGSLSFASLLLAASRRDSTGTLELGGDNGLRGYPLSYQHGDRRAIFTLERRYFSDWFPFHLFRVGGAIFFDAGRAWGTAVTNKINRGVIRDVGVGLRIVSARSAFGNVTHIDLAVPLDRDPAIAGVQFLVSTQNSF